MLLRGFHRGRWLTQNKPDRRKSSSRLTKFPRLWRRETHGTPATNGRFPCRDLEQECENKAERLASRKCQTTSTQAHNTAAAVCRFPSAKLRPYQGHGGILRLVLRLGLGRRGFFLGRSFAKSMLFLLLVLLASCYRLRRRFCVRCLSLSLFRLRVLGLGPFRVAVAIFVMMPELEFCEGVVVLLILGLMLIGIVAARMGNRHRAEQHEADHKTRGSSDLFAHETSISGIVEWLAKAHKHNRHVTVITKVLMSHTSVTPSCPLFLVLSHRSPGEDRC